MSGDGEIIGIEISLPAGHIVSVVNAYFPLGVLEMRPQDAALLNCGRWCQLKRISVENVSGSWLQKIIILDV